jgi:hypothetical protein
MQKLLIFLLLVVLCATSTQSQVVETEKAMHKGVNTALMLEIPDADKKIVEKVWKSYAKSFKGKVKKVKKSDDFVTESPNIAGFSEAGLNNIVVRFEQSGEEVEFYSWFELRDQYLSSYHFPAEFDEAQKVLLNFGLEVAKEYTLMELDTEEKSLKKMENELNRLVKDKSNYEKAIEDYKQKIITAEADIENNLVEQARKEEEINSQNEYIEVVKKKLANLNN